MAHDGIRRSGPRDDASGVSVPSMEEVLGAMGADYRADPMKAVRAQSFIKRLHEYLVERFQSRLTDFAVNRGIIVKHEATLLGSTKPKDVDVAVIDPDNGPLIILGVRSQMSSVGKNVLTYYEGIVGECISLQDRFPMAIHGYLYLHPLRSIMPGKESESIDHRRYAQLYAAVAHRRGPGYKNLRGLFDEFGYMIVDFDSDPPTLRDDLLTGIPGEIDLRAETLVDRIINLFKQRTLFWDVFS